MSQPLLSQRFRDALVFSYDAHACQARKGGSVPYISHPLGVASLVLEDGGTEDEAIAALLHDVCEDQPVTVADIESRFGDEVAHIVDACTEPEHDSRPWRVRKEAAIHHIAAETHPGILRVSIADKLHNATTMLADFRQHGDPLWERFNAGKSDQEWYYRSLVEAFRTRGSPVSSQDSKA